MMRWLWIVCLILLAGCATTRIYTISARPPGATILVDGMRKGTGQITQKITFKNGDDQHQITAILPGYQDRTITLTRGDKQPDISIDLQPMQKTLTFSVQPAATISINGVPTSSGPVYQVSRTLDFTKNPQGNWTTYRISAQREGFETRTFTVSYSDPSPSYSIQLQPLHKDVTINTAPSGALIELDGQIVGNSPTVARDVAFPYDLNTGQFATHRITVNKPGYDPISQAISWDDGKTTYDIDVPAKHKVVQIATDPAGATVTLDGVALQHTNSGDAVADLTYVPVDEQGTLPTFRFTVGKRTSETEWYPQTLEIPWDDGRTDYSVTLKEVRTRVVPLLAVSLQRDSDGLWQILPRQSDTLAMKDVSEGPGKEPPALLWQAPRGVQIDTLAVSPTGSTVLFTELFLQHRQAPRWQPPGQDLRAQVFSISADGTGGVEQLTDGRALDIQPSFTPDGNGIVFSSNRAGRRLNIWRKSLDGGAGIEQLTSSDEQDLWPNIDAAPKPRLFYEVLSDSEPDPQLYVSPVDGGPRADLTSFGISQPRISPKADSIIFTSVNQRTGNREIYRIPDRGGPPVDLTNDPDSDCYDPAWSKDGNMIAYTCDRGRDENRRRNADIWIIDLQHPDKPIQVTSNGSVDDCPSWDPSGNAIYFRSNRGGQWGIWKINIR